MTPLAAGDRLGPYEIVAPLGAGGMGEVYKARDTRLERTVAIKVAKDAFTERFRNEALAIAALNHPHIATLFDVGPDYLVMEHVEGQPLRGPLPVEKALRLAGQIADALEHAHGHGIVHRDLKPSNVLVTKAGVKLVDFGLAHRSTPLSDSDQGVAANNVDGAFVGTPRYMAPEQIDGKAADERTDVFAFGLVLYEMLTGQRPFEGRSAAGVMASILEKDPTPIATLLPTISPAVERVVKTCLAKAPAERWQSVRELKHALIWAAEAPASRPKVPRRWLVAAAVAAMLVLASGVALLRFISKPARPQPVRLHISLPPKALEGVGSFAVSPDGRRLALAVPFSDNTRLLVRPLDGLTATEVPGSEGTFGPLWAPDSRQIAFWGLTGGLHKVDLAGGPVQLVCKDCRRSGGGTDVGATWGSTDVIVYSDGGRLFRVSAQGGDPEPVGALAPGETARFGPRFLPDGRHYLYLSLTTRKEDQGIYVGALGSDLRKRLVASEYPAAYSPPGYLLYIKEGVLVAHPFDTGRLTASGEPAPILDEEVARVSAPVLAYAAFSVSANGVLAWRPAMRGHQQLTWFDREGRRVGTIGEPGVYQLMDISPDEKTVAVCREIPPRDIWLIDVESGAFRRLTFDPHDDCGATFSPDGRTIIFFSDRRGVRELYRKPADGSGEDELLLASNDVRLHPESWSADGRFLSYNAEKPGQGHDIYLLPLSPGGDPAPIPLLVTPAMETWSTLSPDGRYMAYMSNESGVMQVYVREIAASLRAGPGKWQISARRGVGPMWRPDGKEIFFFDPPTLMAAPVWVDGPTFSVGPPRPLGVSVTDTRWGHARYFATRDGQRFLFAAPATRWEPIRVLVNWLPPAP